MCGSDIRVRGGIAVVDRDKFGDDRIEVEDYRVAEGLRVDGVVRLRARLSHLLP